MKKQVAETVSGRSAQLIRIWGGVFLANIASTQVFRPDVQKERPAILPANFTVRDESVSLDLPIKDHPYALALPVWGDAGFLRSVRIDDPLPETFFHIYHWIPPNVRESLNISQDEDYRVWAWGRVDTSLFARAIAKIAYCHTVIWLGLGGFRRLALPGVILGTCSAVSYFVGGALKDPPPKFDTKALHTIQFNNLTGVASKLRLYIVSIRLFAHSGSGQHGMPIYHVVVGAPLVGSSAIR